MIVNPTKIREIKSYVMGFWGAGSMIQRRMQRYFTKNKRPAVVLLSMGGRFGSPMLAQRLLNEGFDVFVVARKLPGHEIKYSVKWVLCDCLGEYDALLRRIERINPVGIYSEMRNVLLPVKSRLIDDVGLKKFGNKPALISVSKIAMRKAIDETKLPNVKWEILSNKTDVSAFQYPCIIKPDLGTGSRGVHFVRDQKALDSVKEKTKNESISEYHGGDLLIEEFATGRLFDVSGVSCNGIPYPLCITEMDFSPIGTAVPCSWYLFSPPIEENLNNAILERSIDIVRAMGVVNGGWTCETRLDRFNQLVPIDFANRPAYPKMVSTASGEDFLTLYIKSMQSDAFQAPNPKFGSIFQRYIPNDIEFAKWNKMANETPDRIIEFRRMNNNYGSIQLKGKIAVTGKNYFDLVALLEKYGVIPARFNNLYQYPSPRKPNDVINVAGIR